MILLLPDALAPYIISVLSISDLLSIKKLSFNAFAFADFILAALKSKTTSSLIEKKLLSRISSTILTFDYVNYLQI
jgi:hypothetical protein